MTNVTHESIADMDSLMNDETPAVGERLSTVRTRVRFPSRVQPHMDRQTRFVSKQLLAHCTHDFTTVSGGVSLFMKR